ncbi:cell surface A33 antigen [Sorex fumeus]|uniref:cell surface A33 antigen n=1 Tax=Sorex fumeus TaxID=62283 RepID=UPI0024AE5179|nr:cell surface A33 antigen [Sorex fumeus]
MALLGVANRTGSPRETCWPLGSLAAPSNLPGPTCFSIAASGLRSRSDKRTDDRLTDDEDLWAAVGAIHVEGPSEVIRAARGRDVMLPCTYSTQTSDRNGFFQWDKLLQTHTETVFIWKFKEQEPLYGNGYTDRVGVQPNAAESNASITLRDLTMADNGTYECSVSLMSDLQGTSIARVRLLVLVAPSKPICSIEGQTVIGSNIQLSCRSEEGSPEPQYSWKSYDINHKERALVPPGTGQTLALKNISMDMSGYFVCTSQNEVGVETCNITLAVTLPSMNVALYAGIAGGVAAALIILGVIIYCCCCRNRDGDKDAQDARPNRTIYREPPEQMRELSRGREDDDDDPQRRGSPGPYY